MRDPSPGKPGGPPCRGEATLNARGRCGLDIMDVRTVHACVYIETGVNWRRPRTSQTRPVGRPVGPFIIPLEGLRAWAWSTPVGQAKAPRLPTRPPRRAPVTSHQPTLPEQPGKQK